MSSSVLWYGLGLSIGLVLGLPTSNEMVVKLNNDFRSAAKSGTASPEDHCTQLEAMNTRLNAYYAKRNKVNPNHYAFSREACAASFTRAP